MHATTGAPAETVSVAADPHGYDRAVVCSWRPDLLELPGVGPIDAATVLSAWSHPGRCRNEAAFATLAGVAPIPAGSGRTVPSTSSTT